MRTALLFGVAGGLLLSGCTAPSGTPTNLQQLPGRSSQRALPMATPSATLAQKMAALDELSTAGRVRADRVVVKFTAESTPAEQTAVATRFDLTLIRELKELGYKVFALPETQTLEQVLEGLWAEPVVKVAEPDYIHAACAIEVRPLDPRFNEQTNLQQINMPAAWFIHPGDPRDAQIGPTIPDVSDVTVAVLDTGFDFTHPDLNLVPDGNPAGDLEKVYGGIDIVNGDSNAKDDNGHGTLIAGIIGALTDNAGPGGAAQGIASVSWNTRLMPIKVLDENGLGTVTDTAAGIQHAVQTWQAGRGNQSAPPYIVGAENGIFNEPFNARLVINMSFSIEVPNALGEPQLEKDAVNYAVNNGAVLVAAAGDSGKPVDDGFSTAYPAGHSSVIAVGAVDEINQLTVPSNRPKTTVPIADQRFVVAPGVNVLGTQPLSLGSYGVGQGTSVAAAQVSGLCALMWAYFPLLLNEDGLVPTLLESSNEDIVGAAGVDNTTGFGLIDGLAALNGVFEPRPTNDPLIVRAFTDPVLHNVVHFVVLSKYRLMDPAEIPFFLDDQGNVVLINNGAAFSYRIGIDADSDGTLADTELLPIDGAFFPNEIVVAQFDDTTYLGRIFFVQGPPPSPACPAGTLLEPPPPTGDLIVSVTGVPEDFLIDETLPKTVTASTTLTLTDFANS